MDPEHWKEGVRGVALVAGGGGRERRFGRRQRGSGALLRSPTEEIGGGGGGVLDLGRRRLSHSSLLSLASLLDLWGPGFFPRGNGVGWGRVTPDLIQPNVSASHPM